MNSIINNALQKLKEKKIYNPELDLRILLNHSSLKKKNYILSNVKIDDIDIKLFNSFLTKRLNNEPVSKIINKKYFWKSQFFVNSSVLDPRPETELIIEEVLNNVKNKNKELEILDIGTGSGCLAISLAKEFKNSKITAIDISKNALKVAKINIQLHNIEGQINLNLLRLDQIKKKYDIIVSNPPYIDMKSFDNLPIEIKKFEPKIALNGGSDGLKFYRLFARKIDKIMKRDSFFICEIGNNQLNSCKEIFNNTSLVLKKISKDLQKIDRTLTFSKI